MFKPTILTLEDGVQVSTGWEPSPPDFRDYDGAKALSRVYKGWSGELAVPSELPSSVDLRSMFSSIENQGLLGSCAAQAGVGFIEYMERRATGGTKHVDASARFLYKVARKLLGWSGDSGATMRSVMGAVRLCGVCPEEYWPYTTKRPPDPDNFDVEPTGFEYSLAQEFQGLVYFRYDTRYLIKNDMVVSAMKQYLSIGIPQVFGLLGFDSANAGDSPGAIPYPCSGEWARWGHGVMSCGYDDAKVIVNRSCKDEEPTVGAIRLRNSWGTGWGEAGYGWLPYRYFEDGLAWDIWSWVVQRWVDTGAFGL